MAAWGSPADAACRSKCGRQARDAPNYAGQKLSHLNSGTNRLLRLPLLNLARHFLSATARGAGRSVPRRLQHCGPCRVRHRRLCAGMFALRPCCRTGALWVRGTKRRDVPRTAQRLGRAFRLALFLISESPGSAVSTGDVLFPPSAARHFIVAPVRICARACSHLQVPGRRRSRPAADVCFPRQLIQKTPTFRQRETPTTP